MDFLPCNGLNIYDDNTIFSRRSTNRTRYAFARIFHWVHEFGVVDYYPVFPNRFFIAPFAGLNITTTRAAKPNSEFDYDDTEDCWFRYTSKRIKPGCYAGISLNCRLGKRLMVFGQYKFQTEFSNNIFVGEIKYLGFNGQVSDYFKSKVLPYNQAITFGISLSLENSGFYK